jgi:hypothetical protein
VLIRAGLLLWALFWAQSVTATTMCVAAWRDAVRNRVVPVRIYLPAVPARVPLVIWSPGMGATNAGGSVWAHAWAAAGLAVITVQHPGSDDVAFAPGPNRAERRLFATSGVHMIERAGDIGFVMDELARRPREGACDLARIDQDRIGVAGHSLGAWTVQALAGQRFGGERGQIDRRPRAFIGLSGSQLEPGDPAAIFGGIGRPYLVISGTRDGGNDDAVARRTAIWRGLPADGRKYMALFGEATHMMFAGNRPATTPLGQRVESDVIRLSIAFWRRWLLEEPAADAGLANPGLAPDDRWDRK